MNTNVRKKLSMVHIFRAIAVIFILIGHANKVFHMYFNYDWFNMAEWARTGGIDFFFLVSGFMIYYLYHKDIGIREKAKGFLLKRIIKIYPIYWIFTLALILLILVFPQLGDGHEKNWEVIIKSFLLIPTNPILATSWSLSYVVFFYIVFSLLIYKPNYLKPIIASWILVIILAQFNVLFNPNSFIFNFSHLEIMFGVGIAIIVLNKTVKYARFMVISGLVGYILVWANNIYSFFHLRDDYFYCLFAFLIMLGITSFDLKVNTKLPKILDILGTASYSIFISQLPILHFYMLIFSKFNIVNVLGNFGSICMLIVSTIISGCVVYFILEKPLSTIINNRLKHSTKYPKMKSVTVK